MSSQQSLVSPSAKRAKKETLDEVLKRVSPDFQDGDKYSTVLFEPKTRNRRAVIQNFLAVVYNLNSSAFSQQAITSTSTMPITEMRCYFLTSSRVNFRHKGSDRLKPARVFVRDLTEQETKVLVFHSGSGTGKTVELASSAATREADFTLVLQFSSDIDAVFQNVKSTDGEKKVKRNMAALRKILDEIEHILKGNTEAFHDMLLAKQGEFRLVVAIDEASSCRLLTRALISDHEDYFSSEVENFLLEKLMPTGINVPMHVLFSVGGTGACMQYIGSQPTKFKVVEPTATLGLGLYWKSCLREAEVQKRLPGNIQQPKYLDPDQLEKELPILGCLMENGRMASIALGALLVNNQLVVIDEAELVREVVKTFINSNGLMRLNWPEERQPAAAAAACAFSVFLFQWNSETPSNYVDEKTLLDWLYEMRSGVDFTREAAWAVKDENPVKAIVSAYGLLEQRHEPFVTNENGVHSIHRPFVMRASQQLVALQLLGVDVSHMVASNPYGFEVLTTQIIKAALAASSVVAETTRPSIAASLKEIGFRHQKSNTHEGTDILFTMLESVKVVPHYFKEELPGHASSFETCLMEVELETLEVNDVVIDEEVVKGDHDVVMIDQEVAGRLEKLGYKRHETEHFYPPIACVNYGNSPLADGFVTCQARDTSDDENQVFRLSIMNQSKDKHSKGGLPITKLNVHADRCAKEALNGLFGSQRLLCVSTPENVFSDSGKCIIQRKFLPYVLSECKILMQLMTNLSRQRSKEGRIKKHAAFFSSNGKKVELA